MAFKKAQLQRCAASLVMSRTIRYTPILEMHQHPALEFLKCHLHATSAEVK